MKAMLTMHPTGENQLIVYGENTDDIVVVSKTLAFDQIEQTIKETLEKYNIDELLIHGQETYSKKFILKTLTTFQKDVKIRVV